MRLEWWQLKDNLKAALEDPEKVFVNAIQKKVDYIKWAMSKELSERQQKAILLDTEFIKAAEKYYSIMHWCIGEALSQFEQCNHILEEEVTGRNRLQDKFIEMAQENLNLKERIKALENGG
jgi:hypothetical protein